MLIVACLIYGWTNKVEKPPCCRQKPLFSTNRGEIKIIFLFLHPVKQLLRCVKTVLAPACLLVLALLVLCGRASAADISKYDSLIEKCRSWASDRIIAAGDGYKRQGDDEKALVMYMMVCERVKPRMSDADVEACALAHLKTGDIYYEGGNYSRALLFYVDGLKVSERGSGRPYSAVFYKNMGNVYCSFEDYEFGMSLYKKGVECGKEVGDNETVYKIYHNLAAANIYTGDIKSARRYYSELRNTPHTSTAVSRFMDGYTHGFVLKGEGKSAEAVSIFKRLAARAVADGLGPRYECSAYKEVYDAYGKMGNGDSMFVYLNLCNQLAEKSGLQHMFVDDFKSLADFYERKGDRRKALAMRLKYYAVKDSVLDLRELDMVRNQHFLYETEKAQHEISALQRAEEQRTQVIKHQRAIIACVTVGIVLVLLLLLYVYRQKCRLDENYRSLFSLNRQLSAGHKLSGDRNKAGTPQAQPVPPESPATATDGKNDDTKYRGSSLNDGLRDRLASAIADAMDNGTEFCRPDFSLEALARLVGSNSSYVSQTINAVYGKNFSNFVNEYRVRLACRKLADIERYGNITIRGVGESVGYSSYGTFIKVFKNITGMPPSLYQKMVFEEAEKVSRGDIADD